VHTADSLDEDPQRAVRNADQPVDDRRRPDLVQVVPAGGLDLRVPDGNECEEAVTGDDVVDQGNRALLSDRQRRYRLREDDCLLERQNRQDRRNLDVALDRLEVLELNLAHDCLRTGIDALRPSRERSATGRTIVRNPRSYVARASGASTSSGS